MTGKSTWLVGLASAARGMAVAEVAAAILDGRSPIDSVGRLLADKAPLAVVEETVRLLRAADKPVARVQIGAGAGQGQGCWHTAGRSWPG